MTGAGCRPVAVPTAPADPPSAGVLPLREFRRLDLNSEEMGVPVRALMDNAGKALAEAVQDAAPEGAVWLLCGKGNNGGDGYAAALHLQAAGRDVQVVAVEPPEGRESRHYRDQVPDDRVHSWGDVQGKMSGSSDAGGSGTLGTPNVVVDCLLGSGISGKPRPPYDAAVAWIDDRRQAGAVVVACDVPSGLGSALQVHPDVTVTFHAQKEGMADRSGRIVVADIGIPREAQERVGFGDLAVGYPRAGSDSHKGDHGRILVVGGGPFAGAPHYVGMAAYRTGADLVHLATARDAAAAIATWGPDLLVHAVCDGDRLVPAALPRILAHMDHAGAVVVGPGLGRHAESRDAAAAVLAACAERKLPVVIDADGLDAVTPEYLDRNGGRTVLTPHGREFLDLGNQDAEPATVAGYAKAHGVTVLRKGAVDAIASPDRLKTCHRGHPTMTVGGTGDVLAGAVATLLARGAAPFDAACAAAYLVGVAGETAAAHYADGATATDVLEAIPNVLLRLYG